MNPKVNNLTVIEKADKRMIAEQIVNLLAHHKVLYSESESIFQETAEILQAMASGNIIRSLEIR